MQLWHAYLEERRLAARGAHLEDAQLLKLNGTYERALVSMHKMPRIWTDVRLAGPHMTSASLLTCLACPHGAATPACGAYECESQRTLRQAARASPGMSQSMRFDVLQYLEALIAQRQLQLARRTFDRALQALPITQHDRVWVLYLVRLHG